MLGNSEVKMKRHEETVVDSVELGDKLRRDSES